MFSPAEFFETSSFSFQDLFRNTEYVWEALKNIKPYMADFDYSPLPHFVSAGTPLQHTLIFHENQIIEASDRTKIEYGDATKGKLAVSHNGSELEGATVIMAGAVLMGNKLFLGKGVLIEPGALIKEPAIIDDQTEIRQGAYLRGYCIFGKRCVVGHVTEVKHTIFLDDAKAGHFAYLGDSILGNHVNLGAGTKLANLRFTAGNVAIKTSSGSIPTGLRKLGAILGDHVQTGCNSVTNPGTIMAKKSMLLPNTTAPSGLHDSSTIIR